MTSDSPHRGPRRASGGRHAGGARPGPEQARAARQAAFGTSRRTWVDAPGATSRPEQAEEPETEALPPEASEPAAPEERSLQQDHAAQEPEEDRGAQEQEPATERLRAEESEEPESRRPRTRAATGTGIATAARRRAAERRARHAPGGGAAFARVVGWTALTTVLPGTGLITTAMRRTGLVLLALFLVAGLTLGAWVLFGDPVPTLLPLAANRSFMNGLIVLAVIVALLWALQILLTYRAHAVAERLPRKPRIAALAISLLLIAVMLVPFGSGTRSLWAWQSLLGNEKVFGGVDGDGPIKEGKDPWAGVGRLNVLLLGQDAGDDRTGTRPDTIMVASIDTESGRTALFSIPRNLQWVHFPEGTPMDKAFPDGFDAYGHNQNLINAVWAWADEHADKFPGDPNPGLTATTQAVEQTLGLSMDYYAMVDLQGFIDLVNAINGVDMNVERRIPIGGGTNQATGGKYKISGYIEPGWQKLDGYHALWYARSREGSNDFDRICRQQRMVRVVSEEADPTTLVFAFPRLVTATKNNIQTDIPSKRLDAFADLGLRVKKAGFESYPITPDVTNPGKPDWKYIHKWVQASLKDSMKDVGSPQSVKGANGKSSPEDESASKSDGGGAESTSASTEATTSSKKKDDKDPTIVEDPLKSCLPGSEEDPNATSAT